MLQEDFPNFTMWSSNVVISHCHLVCSYMVLERILISNSVQLLSVKNSIAAENDANDSSSTVDKDTEAV